LFWLGPIQHSGKLAFSCSIVRESTTSNICSRWTCPTTSSWHSNLWVS